MDGKTLAELRPSPEEMDVVLGGNRPPPRPRVGSGFLLGGEAPGIADIVTATLWSTMAERFRKIEAILDEAAPMTAALARRLADRPPLAKLAAKARKDYGETYCGGEIEASLKKVLSA